MAPLAGTQHRPLREGCSLRLEEVAAGLDFPQSTLSRIETRQHAGLDQLPAVMLDP